MPFCKAKNPRSTASGNRPGNAEDSADGCICRCVRGGSVPARRFTFCTALLLGLRLGLLPDVFGLLGRILSQRLGGSFRGLDRFHGLFYQVFTNFLFSACGRLRRRQFAFFGGMPRLIFIRYKNSDMSLATDLIHPFNISLSIILIIAVIFSKINR